MNSHSPQPQRVSAGTGAAHHGTASLGLEPPKEGSPRQVSAAFPVGAVRETNHCIEPKSNKSLIHVLGTKWPQGTLGFPLLPGLVPPSAGPAPSLKHQQHPGYVLVWVIGSSWTLVLLPERPYFLYLFTNFLGS